MKFSTIVLLLLVVVLMFSGCEGNPVEPTAEVTVTSAPPVEEPGETTVTTSDLSEEEREETTGPSTMMTELKMTYLSVMLPERDLGDLLFEKVVDGDVVMEVFSLKKDSGLLELFRVFYGDTEYGNCIGVLNVDGDELNVSVSASNYDEGFFVDEAQGDRYYEMMENLNLVVAAIRADSRFTSGDGTAIDKVETQVAEWNFQLPEMVQWEEIRNEDAIKLVFFADINGTRADLYALAIGGEPLQSVLGQYLSDGEMKPISIGTCSTPDMEGWDEKNLTNYYQMMDSINDVIQAVQSNENFSEEVD